MQRHCSTPDPNDAIFPVVAPGGGANDDNGLPFVPIVEVMPSLNWEIRSIVTTPPSLNPPALI
jgi:hypothetical protein